MPDNEKTYKYSLFCGDKRLASNVMDPNFFLAQTNSPGTILQVAAKLIKFWHLSSHGPAYDPNLLCAYEKTPENKYKDTPLISFAEAVQKHPEIDAVFAENKPINFKLGKVAPWLPKSNGPAEIFHISDVTFSDIFHILYTIGERTRNAYKPLALSADQRWKILTNDECQILHREGRSEKFTPETAKCEEILRQYFWKFRQ